MTNLNCSADATIKQSKRVRRPHIFCQGLGVVAPLTEPLPVLLIPEQLTVTTVRYDMVNHGGGCQLAVSLALHAQRVGAKKRFADTPPASVVDIVLNPTVVLPLSVGMVFTVSVTSVSKTWAAGNGTRMP